MTQIHHTAQRNTHLLLLVIAAFLMSMGSCKKEPSTPSDPHDPNTLPPLTHEGKNTFGCLVNGEVWVAYAPFTVGGATSLNGNYMSESGDLYIEATRKSKDGDYFETIGIGAEEVFQIGIYEMPIISENIEGFFDYKGNFQCSKYYYRSELPHEIKITYFSLGQGIVSGTFEMDLVNPSCPGDTIRIREGRFDWRMTVY